MSPAGRPEIGTPVNIRLGNDLLAQVDAYAEAESVKQGRRVNRAEAIRQLVQQGLRRTKR
jgi:Arc/MetJ-type ribon-helix-helix transcriptional regulator